MKKILLALTFLLSIVAVHAAERQSYIYNIVDTDTLSLDFYRADSSKPTPALIFAFGGGFVGGDRANGSYIPMFEYLTANGVSVISIDYRTRLKGLSPATLNSTQAVVDRLIDAISCATADFLQATGFVLSKAGEWNINPALIFASGSSAGAITALQAEYVLCNEGVSAFPVGFNYGGIITFAGALFCDDAIYWNHNPAPMLLFHGDADSNVPFDELTISGAGLYGSATISKSLIDEGICHWFHRFNGADHSIAVEPMTSKRGEVLDFINAVAAGELKIVESVETVRTDNYRTEFTMQDFISSNFK